MKTNFQLVFVVFLFLLNSELSAQKLSPPQQQQLNNLYKSKKVVYFKFRVHSMQEIGQMARIISVDKNKGTEVAAHATKEQFAKFLPFNYKYTVSAGSGTVKKKVVPKGTKTVKKK